MASRRRYAAAVFGFASIGVFFLSFIYFGIADPNFNVFSDYISKLGSFENPNAACWNLTGFATVGILLAVFGWLYGVCGNDRVLGVCLVFGGFGFALAAIPADFSDDESPLSRAHFASICFSLAGWCFGLARIMGSTSASDFDKMTAKAIAVAAVVPILCVAGGISTEPVAHRVLLLLVFGWVGLSSFWVLPMQEDGPVLKERPG